MDKKNSPKVCQSTYKTAEALKEFLSFPKDTFISLKDKFVKKSVHYHVTIKKENKEKKHFDGGKKSKKFY